MKKEQWKPVMEIAGGTMFQVSSRGRVRETATGKLSKPVRTKAGFLVVRARVGATRKNITLHRLVAQNFLPGTPTYPVLFKDGNRNRCTVSNLRWAKSKDQKIRFHKLTYEDVRYIRTNWPAKTQWALAEEFGVCRDTIHQVVSGKTWTGSRCEVSGVGAV